MTLPETWNIRLGGVNTLVLDQLQLSIDGGPWQKKEFFIFADNVIRDHLDIPRRGGAMAQPYTRSKTDSTGAGVPVKLRYSFEVKERPQDLYLGIETPELFTFELNGQTFSPVDSGCWVDPAIRKMSVPVSLLRTGENILTLQSIYHAGHPGIESLFLLGDFGVDAHDALIRRPETLQTGNWCSQGLPYYADNLTYFCDIAIDTLPAHPLWLEIGNWRGALLGVSVNGGKEELLPWPPYTLDISPYLKPGNNRISITVYGHRRNSFGPFYMNEATPFWNGPLQFKTRQQDDKQLVPCGLLSDVKLVY
jgi:hypothetical protein